MLHDTPNIGSKKFYDAATEIIKIINCKLKNTLSVNNQKLVISISGESGCGKSTIAHQLSKRIMHDFRKIKNDISVKHLYVDNFYTENNKMISLLKREDRIIARNYAGIGPDEYDWSMIDNVLYCFANGFICRMPCVDLLNQEIDYLETNFLEVDILILDGLYAIDERLQADFRFLVDGAYYQINNWEEERRKYVEKFDTIEGLYDYAREITSKTTYNSYQDIRGKEKLTEARVIRLEKEHKALLRMTSSIKNKNIDFLTLKYNKDSWKIL
ncbi:MAG: hypothetical protein GY702_05930 [Desulfobulbaceae bacterium]|nr:hypothetical protein [Desulfobulbaceae bacterium]